MANSIFKSMFLALFMGGTLFVVSPSNAQTVSPDSGKTKDSITFEDRKVNDQQIGSVAGTLAGFIAGTYAAEPLDRVPEPETDKNPEKSLYDKTKGIFKNTTSDIIYNPTQDLILDWIVKKSTGTTIIKIKEQSINFAKETAKDAANRLSSAWTWLYGR
jgi:hypothetical protein